MNKHYDFTMKHKLIKAWSVKINKMTEEELNNTIETLNKALLSAKKLHNNDLLKVSALIFALKALNIAY